MMNINAKLIHIDNYTHGHNLDTTHVSIGVPVVACSSRVRKVMSKPKILDLVLASTPLSTRHYGVRTNTVDSESEECVAERCSHFLWIVAM